MQVEGFFLSLKVNLATTGARDLYLATTEAGDPDLVTAGVGELDLTPNTLEGAFLDSFNFTDMNNFSKVTFS